MSEQSKEEIDTIIQNKVTESVNKKVIDDMSSAIEEIEKNKQADEKVALVGIALLIAMIVLLSFIFTTLL